MGVMTVMTPTDGDLPVRWDPRNEKQTEEARRMFADLKAKGYAFFEVAEGKGRKSAKAGEQVREFDPKAGEILARPGLAGG